MNCINISQLISFHNKELGSKEHKEIGEHIGMCSDCQKKIEKYNNFLILFKKSYQPLQSSADSQCYDDSDLLGFLEATHTKKSREAFYVHLMECQKCMDRLISLERVFNELRQENLLISDYKVIDKIAEFISTVRFKLEKKLKDSWAIPKPFRPVYGVVVSFLVLFISVTAFLIIDTFDETKIITRDNQFEDIQTEIRIISPIDNSKLNIKKHEFQWKGSDKIILYNFFLLDNRGNIIWETSINNNKIMLPEKIRLNNNHLYFWQIESIFEDGTTMLSPMVSFTNIF